MRFTVRQSFIRLLGACALGVLAVCVDPQFGDYITIDLAGTASMGTPVRTATLVVSSVDATGNALTQVATATTAEDGTFSLDVSAAVPGPGTACIAGGAYVDPATNSFVPLGNLTLCAFVPDLAEPPAQLAISPWTHLVVTYARHLARHTGSPIALAYTQARDAFNAFLSCTSAAQNVVEAVPINPTEEATAPPPPELRAGVLLGGLSSQALLISEDLGYSPGIRFTGVQLADGYTKDIAADGRFDGLAGDDALVVEGYEITSQSLRAAENTGFVQGLRHFLGHERNATGVQVADLADLLDCLAEYSAPPFVDDGTTADFAGPDVVFDLDAGAVLSGILEVCATVTDESGVRSAQFDPVISGTTFVDGRLCAPYDTTSHPDGEHTITVRASDMLDNETLEDLEVTINNGGPTIELTSPAEQTELEALQTFTFDVTDNDGVDAVTITSPIEVSATKVGPTAWEATFDTTAHPDGELVVTVLTTDTLGVSSQEHFRFANDHLAPGSFSGCVFADSDPFAGAAISGCLLTVDGCAVVEGSATTGPNGCFVLPLPDNIEGLVQVRATGGSYLDGSTGALVISGTFTGWTHTVPYVPSEDGTVFEHRSLNAWTTFADAWAVARAADSTYSTLEDALATAYQLHGEHIDVPIATTYARDIVPDSNSAHTGLLDDESTRLGLSLVGLSQQATRIALDNGRPADAANTLSLVAVIRRSALSGLHDGLDADGQPVTLFASTFNANSLLRKGHSDAVAGWLISDRNTTGLTVDAYAGAGGMLTEMAVNAEPLLFGELEPIEFDNDAPAVTVELVDAAGTPPQTAPLIVGQIVWLHMTAVDASGFRNSTGGLVAPVATVFNAGGQPQPAGALGAMEVLAETGDTLSVRWPLLRGLLADGAHTASVVASDGAGNTAAAVSVPFAVDATPPAVGIAVQYTNAGLQLVAGSTFNVDWSQSDASSPTVRLGLERSLDGTTVQPAGPVINSPAPSGTSSVDLGSCVPSATVRAYAVDAAGNRGTTAWATVKCDGTPPSIVLDDQSAYTPANTGHEEYEGGGATGYTRTSGLPRTVKGDWPAVQDLSLWHDEYEPDSPLVPIVRVAVADVGTTFTPLNQLMVWYSYRWETAGGTLLDSYAVPEGVPPGTGVISVRIDPATLGDLPLNTALPTHVHALTFHARDLAGNESELTYRWRFQWRWPTTYVRDCRLRPIVTSATLNSGTIIESLFDGGQKRLWQGEVFWSYAGSVTPPDILRLAVSTAAVHTEANALYSDRVDGIYENNVSRACPNDNMHKFTDEADCRSGYLSADVPDNTTPKPTSDNATLYGLEGGAMSGSGVLALTPGLQLDLDIGAALNLEHQGADVFTAAHRYAPGLYAISSRDGHDEIFHHTTQQCDGEGCWDYPTTDKQFWQLHTAVDRYLLRVGAVSVSATMQLRAGTASTPVSRDASCSAMSYVHSSTAP